MAEHKHRILVVSGRLLMAQGMVSLLEEAPSIEQVDVVSSLYDALMYCKQNTPDALVIDLPSGADYFVDRPFTVEGKEIKTIVLLEEEQNGQAHLYVHTPRRTANLKNLMSAILLDGESYVPEAIKGGKLHVLKDVLSGGQPTSFINAKASDPKSSRISISSTEL